MRSKIVAGNWKMNGSKNQIHALLQQLVDLIELAENSECVVIPPAIYLPLTNELLQGTTITWGAQNAYPQNYGAFTGELSAVMLKEFGCRYVLVGHSERRQLFAEKEKFIADKFHHVKEHGIIPILCVGETLKERESGLTESVLIRQLVAVTEKDAHCFKHSVIAYEPIWAIGTGKTATPEQAQQAHAFIRSFVAQFDQDAAASLAILYGGSVNEQNAAALFAMPDVDGGLVGGASLNAQQFVDIVKCIS